MLALWSRRYYSAARRTIPYVTKGNWNLPPLDAGQGPASAVPANEDAGAPHEWGKPVSKEASPRAVNVPNDWRRLRTIPQWKKQMFALKEKFPDGWKPLRKLSRDEMNEVRALKAAQPHISLNELGSMFRTSPEAVRRIVKSKWRASPEEEAKLQERWQRRGTRLGSPKVRTAPRKHRKLRDPGNEVF